MSITASCVRVLLCWLAVVAATPTAPASAATWWWDTTTTGLWTNGANWSNDATSGGTTGTVPTNNTTTDNVVFNQSSVNGNETVQLSADRSIRGIVIANTGSTALQSDSATARLLTLGADGIVVNAGAGAVTLGGAANPLNLAMSVTGSINNNSSSLVTINSNISRTASETSNRRLWIGGTGNTVMNGVLSNGGASGTLEFFKTGSGTLTLTGANTFSGQANLIPASGNNGTVLIGVDSVGSVGAITSSAFGTGTIALTGGGSVTIAGNDSVTKRTILNPIVNSTFGGGLTFGDGVNNASIELAGGYTHWYTAIITNNLGGSGVLTMSGPVNVVDNGNRNFQITGPGRTVITGTISNAGSGYTGGLSLSGPGAVTLAAQNTYLGNTSLSGTATVRVGSSSIVQSGSIVSGPFGLGQVGVGGSGVVVTISGDDSATKRTVANRFNFDFGTFNYGDGVNDASLEFSGLMNSLYGGTQFTNNLASGTLTFSGTLSPNPSGGKTMTFAGNGRTEVTGVIVNGTSASPTASNVTKNGNGMLVMSGQNIYTGQTTLGAGVLAVQGTENVGVAGPMGIGGTIVLNGGTLQYSSANQFDYSSRFSTGGSQRYNVDTNGRNVSWATALTSSGGSLTKLGSGTLTLTAVNTYSGVTTISAGVLALSGSGALATSGTVNPASGATFDISGITASSLTIGAITGSAGSAVALGSKTLAIGDATSTTFASAVSGAGGLTKQGAGTVTLTAANIYTGTTTLTAGILNLGTAETAGTSGALGNSAASNPGSIVLSGGTLQYSAANQNDYSGRFSTAASQRYNVDTNGQNVTWATALTSSSGALTKSGSGTLFLTGANTYTGTTTLTAGVLNLGSAENAGVSGPVGVGGTIVFGTAAGGGGTLQYSTANQFDYSSRFSTAAGQKYIVDTNGQSVTWATAAPSSSAATFTKLGSGTLTLSGNNGWGGLTTISAGVLATSGDERIGNSSIVSVASGATFRIGGAETTAGLMGSGTVDLGANKLTLSLASSGTFSGLIIGTGILGVGGSGDFYITGSNSYSGGTDLRAARTFISNDASLGTGAITLGAFGATTLASADTNTRTLTNNLSSGVGNAWTFGTPTTGNLIFAGTWTNNLGAGNTITVDNALTQFTNGLGGGTAIRTKLGAGTLAVGGVSTYTGTTTINAGTFQLGTGGTDGTLSTSSVITGSAGATFAVSRTNLVSQGADFRSDVRGGIGLSQLGTGTLALTGSNSYTGPTTVGAGVVRFGTLAAGSGTQSLGSGSVVNLGVAATSAGELEYNGAGGMLDKNVFALGTGRNRIRNSGAGTLTLSGTLTKDGTILELAGGTFNVTGQITGASANSDFFINGANVTLSNTNNNYNGPTYVYGNGTLTLGASNVVPSGSALLLGGTGGDTGSGSIITGTFTDTVASLTTSALSGTVGITVSGATAGGLTTTGDLTLGGSSDTLALTLSGLNQTRYTLVAYQGTRSGTFDTITGLDAAPTYTIVYGGSSNGSIDLALKADQTLSLTPAASRVLVGGSTTLAGTLANTTPTGGADLAVSLASNGTLTANNFSSSSGATVTAGGTSTVSATLLAGGTAGSQSWSVVNTDNSAITTTATSSGSISVVNQRTFTTSTSTLALGLVHQGASFGSPTLVVTSTGLYATTASGTLNGFTGGPAGLSLGLTSGSAAFNGGSSPQSATYTLSGVAGTAGILSGTFTSSVAAELGTISDITVAVTGQVFSGTATWNVAGGGAWGTGASANWTSAGGVGAAPGTFAGYGDTDVAIFAGSQSGTSTILLDGATPSLASLAFTNTTARYVIDQGSGGSLTLATTTGMPTVDVAANALAEIRTGILGSQGLQKIGAGTLLLSGSSNYSGGTDVSAGMLTVNGSVGGTVSVASAAVLSGSGTIGGLVSMLGGGILAPGDGGPGTLLAGGGLSLVNTAILNFQLSAMNFTAGGGINDLVNVIGDFALDGILNVDPLGALDFTAVPAGTSWRLFNYSGGSFTNGGLSFGSMPSLADGRSFQIDTATSGQVNLVIFAAVPEPGAFALAAAGLGAWGLGRWRRRRTVREASTP